MKYRVLMRTSRRMTGMYAVTREVAYSFLSGTFATNGRICTNERYNNNKNTKVNQTTTTTTTRFDPQIRDRVKYATKHQE